MSAVLYGALLFATDWWGGVVLHDRQPAANQWRGVAVIFGLPFCGGSPLLLSPLAGCVAGLQHHEDCWLPLGNQHFIFSTLFLSPPPPPLFHGFHGQARFHNFHTITI